MGRGGGRGCLVYRRGLMSRSGRGSGRVCGVWGWMEQINFVFIMVMLRISLFFRLYCISN